MEVRPIQLASLRPRPDARPLDPAHVRALGDSMMVSGLMQPISVRSIDDGFEIRFGHHRAAAARGLGWASIDAAVVDDDDLHAELAMIDENLCRAELSPADRARQTARRKAIYVELHPETAAGSSQAAGMNAAQERGRQVGDDVDRFTTNTAKATGQSERTVQRDAERGQKVAEAVLDLVRGTKLDSGAYLDKLKKLPANEQMAMAERDLAPSEVKSNSSPPPRHSSATSEPQLFQKHDGVDEDEDDISFDDHLQYLPLQRSWDAAGQAARDYFMKENGLVLK